MVTDTDNQSEILRKYLAIPQFVVWERRRLEGVFSIMY